MKCTTIINCYQCSTITIPLADDAVADCTELCVDAGALSVDVADCVELCVDVGTSSVDVVGCTELRVDSGASAAEVVGCTEVRVDRGAVSVETFIVPFSFDVVVN